MFSKLVENQLPKINQTELFAYLKNKSEYEILFTGTTRSYCIGIVDIVNSTAITANLASGKMCEYYSIFLNAMSKIAKAHNAVVIKNLGDSLLYYFPQTWDASGTLEFSDVLECSINMVDSRDIINKIMSENNLPSLDFRVSADYGVVSIAYTSQSQMEDMFGPTLNICSKINGAARPNSIVIGGDLHQIVRHFKKYEFKVIGGYMLGFRMNYPVYSVTLKNP